MYLSLYNKKLTVLVKFISSKQNYKLLCIFSIYTKNSTDIFGILYYTSIIKITFTNKVIQEAVSYRLKE